MNEFEQMLNARLEEAFGRSLAAASCFVCGLIMIDAPDGSPRLWCPMCGEFKDAS